MRVADPSLIGNSQFSAQVTPEVAFILCTLFPQAYSHVGLIHAAFAATPRWSDVA
jgi:hypothetical protein